MQQITQFPIDIIDNNVIKMHLYILLKALYQNDKFTEEEMHNYRMAVTEREVRNGCITMPDDYVKDHVIIYTRILRNINL